MAAAAIPPKLLKHPYATALVTSPLCIILTISTEYVENVVKLPQNPTPNNNFCLAVNPCVIDVDGACAAVGILILGVPKTPPRMNEPTTLILL